MKVCVRCNKEKELTELRTMATILSTTVNFLNIKLIL